MKKLLIIAILLASTGITILTAEAKTASTKTISSNVAQITIQLGNNKRYQPRRRVVTRHRIIRINGRYYRETYQIIYQRNGRRQYRVISRVRIR